MVCQVGAGELGWGHGGGLGWVGGLGKGALGWGGCGAGHLQRLAGGGGGEPEAVKAASRGGQGCGQSAVNGTGPRVTFCSSPSSPSPAA